MIGIPAAQLSGKDHSSLKGEQLYEKCVHRAFWEREEISLPGNILMCLYLFVRTAGEVGCSADQMVT